MEELRRKLSKVPGVASVKYDPVKKQITGCFGLSLSRRKLIEARRLTPGLDRMEAGYDPRKDQLPHLSTFDADNVSFRFPCKRGPTGEFHISIIRNTLSDTSRTSALNFFRKISELHLQQLR